MKINFKCWTWGMSCVREETNKLVSTLNTKDWTKKEKSIIEKCLRMIEDSMEGLKEEAWGDEA